MDATTPACFDSAAQFVLWLEPTALAPTGHLGVCEDCTDFYQAAMRRAGRCSRPGMVFDGRGLPAVPDVPARRAGFFHGTRCAVDGTTVRNARDGDRCVECQRRSSAARHLGKNRPAIPAQIGG